jgi:hypothetical protein
MIVVLLGKIRGIDQISSARVQPQWPRLTQGLEDLLNYFAHSEVADSSHPVRSHLPKTPLSTRLCAPLSRILVCGDYPAARDVNSQTNSSSTESMFYGPMKFLELTRGAGLRTLPHSVYCRRREDCIRDMESLQVDTVS